MMEGAGCSVSDNIVRFSALSFRKNIEEE